MLRHAYLIIAHSNWDQLTILLDALDAKNHTIYIHIDKKVKNVPLDKLKNAVKFSHIYIYQEYKVYWGSYALVQTELFLFEKAHQQHFDYYHLLSGADLPIKSQQYIDDFFEKRKGFEFVHFDTDERLKNDKEIGRRTRLYHFLQNYRRRYKISVVNSFFTFLERVLLVIQLLLGVNRMKKYSEFVIKYGSQWVSITDDLVSYILKNKKIIDEIFSCTNCADELFIQTLVYNSEYKNKLYNKNFDDDNCGNMRLVDIKKRGKNGNPYIWKISDLNEIKNSPCLFARKFDKNKDIKIIEKVIELCKMTDAVVNEI